MTSPADIFEQNEAQRKKVLTELAEQGLDLRPVGQTSVVGLLYIMERSHKKLTAELRTALENATRGLNFLKTEYGILSLDDLREEIDAGRCSLSLPEAVETYVQVLDPGSVVLLEASILEVWPPQLELTDAPLNARNMVSKHGTYDLRPVATVTDFFGCFMEPELKKIAWAQMLPATKAPVF